MEVPEFQAQDLGGATPEGSRNPKREGWGVGGSRQVEEVYGGVLICVPEISLCLWWGGDTGSQGTREKATAVVQVGENMS